jgi:hypothetical protein
LNNKSWCLYFSEPAGISCRVVLAFCVGIARRSAIPMVFKETVMRLIKNSRSTWGVVVAVLTASVFFGGAGMSFANSGSYCDSYAKDYADRNTDTGGNVLGGALGGAATGALLGGIIGGGRGAGTGAAIGGGVGALGGTAQASNSWSYNYDRAYDRCMSGKR